MTGNEAARERAREKVWETFRGKVDWTTGFNAGWQAAYAQGREDAILEAAREAESTKVQINTPHGIDWTDSDIGKEIGASIRALGKNGGGGENG